MSLRTDILLWAQRVNARKGSPPWVLLEIHEQSTAEQVQAAFHKIARTAHPDLHRHGLSAEELELVTSAYAAVAGAYQQMRSTVMQTTRMRVIKPDEMTKLGATPLTPPPRASPTPPGGARTTTSTPPGGARTVHVVSSTDVGAPRQRASTDAGRTRHPSSDPPTTRRPSSEPRPARAGTDSGSPYNTPAGPRHARAATDSGGPPTPQPTVATGSQPPSGITHVPATPSGAAPSANAAQAMSSKALLYYRKAELCLKRGDLKGAILQLKLACAADPTSAFLRTALAEVETEVRKTL